MNNSPTREDLAFMCRMLNMADSVDEVRQQLGLTENSRISFDDFLHCRSRVMLESSIQHAAQRPCPGVASVQSPALMSGEDTGVESDTSCRVGHTPVNHLTSWPTLSSDSLGKFICGSVCFVCHMYVIDLLTAGRAESERERERAKPLCISCILMYLMRSIYLFCF